MTGIRAKFGLAAAVAAALLFAGCGNRPATAAPVSEIAIGAGHAATATDVSARRRIRHVRRYRVYRPYYGYYGPRPYYGPRYYGPGYYGPGYYGYGPGYYRPGISFGFGFGPRW